MNYGNQAHSAFHGNKEWGCGGHYRGGKFWQKWAGMHSGNLGRGSISYVPVNIEESETSYELHIFAPGRTKAFFSLSLKDRILTVSYKSPEATDPDTARWSKQEYQTANFDRTFLLNPKIDETDISAQYTEGVLQVTLPKTAEAQQPPKSIELI